jgi:hypothetical protein
MQIKRFVASSLAALMAGATFAGAALAATSVGGVLKTLGSQAAATPSTPYLVVVGDTAAASDVVGAIDVASALAQQVTREVTIPGVSVATLTGGVSLDTADTKLYLGDYIDSAIQMLTSNDLPTVLKAGTVEDKAGTKYDYNQYLTIGHKQIMYNQPDVSSGLKDPTYLIKLGTDASTGYLVQAWVSFTKSFNATDAVGKTIKLFGKEFTISAESALDNSKLVLFGVSGKETIQAGESKTITVGGNSYTVRVIGVIDHTSAVIEVNGVQKEVVEGNTYDFAGTSVYVSDVFYVKVPQETGYVVVSIGADRYVLQDGQPIKVGSSGSEQNIKGTHVQLLRSSNRLTDIKINFDAYSAAPAVDYVKAGSVFNLPVFGLKVAYNGPASVPSETITIQPGATNYYSLTFTDSFGKTGTINWVYDSNTNTAGGETLADSAGNVIHVVEGEGLTGLNQYVVISSGIAQHILKLTSYTTGTSKADVEFQDVLSGTTYKGEADSTGRILVIDGQQFTLSVTNPNNVLSNSNPLKVTWSPSGTVVVYPTIKTKYGAKIALVKEGAVQLTVPNDGSLKIILPTGSVTITDTASGGSYDLKVTKINDETLATPIDVPAHATDYDVVQVGNVYYALREPATPSGDLFIGLDSNQDNDSADTVLNVPAVLVIEEPRKGATDGVVGIFTVVNDATTDKRLELYGGTLPSTVFDASAVSTSSNNVNHYVTKWGTKVVLDMSGAGTAIITYPDSQVYHLVAVGENPSWITAATEAGTYKTYAPLSLPVSKLASEVTPADKTNANIVLVGGPCANSLVQALVDAGKLDASMTCAGGNPGPAWTPGVAYVKVVEDAFATGRVALVVAGTNAADTRLATSLLSQGRLADRTEDGVRVSGTVTTPVVTPM